MKKTHLLRSLSLIPTIVWLTGCETIPQTTTSEHPTPTPIDVPEGPQWNIFDSATGDSLDWDTATSRVFKADVIVVGEQHDNQVGHQVETELSKELLSRSPSSCIALEMFERNEQAFVDLYLDGKIAAATLIKVTNSANWGGGTNTWDEFYQPIVDAVKNHRISGAELKAANCPRAYVQLARMEGFEAIASIQDNTATLFEIPDLSVDDSPYKERFVALMNPKPAHPSPNEEKAESQTPSMGMHTIDPEAFFRAQQVWDASMADSVIDAKTMHPKVMLFVGEFHMAHEGGLIHRIRAKSPELRLATISILRSEDVDTFNSADTGRADLIIYTY